MLTSYSDKIGSTEKESGGDLTASVQPVLCNVHASHTVSNLEDWLAGSNQIHAAGHVYILSCMSFPQKKP